MAEFALTLPLLLLLLFGIIEFARIFQAWVVLQNAARTAARYAITGQVDPAALEAIADAFAISVGDTAAAADPETRLKLCQDNDHRGTHSDFGPYTPTGVNDYESIFANHWDGLDCQPGSEEDQGLINDLGRIQSIRDQARVGAAGLDLRMFDEEAYAVETDPGTGDFVRWANDDKPGWFHVFICSSRPTLREGDELDDLRYTPSRDDLTCTVQEYRGAPPAGYRDFNDDPQSVNNYGTNQWDAGGPGDAVEIIITFNHPLITPLALPTYVRLQARRVMINEAFRASRVVNLPPVLALPTNTPSVTPPPSDTPLPSDTPPATDTPSATPTATETGTPTPTATPDCNLIQINSVGFSGAYLQVGIHNDNVASVVLEGVRLEWKKHTLFPNMYADWMQWNGQTHWDGTDTTPPTRTGLAPGPGTTDLTWNNNANVTLNGGTTSTWQVRFGNGPFNLASYYNTPDFSGSAWYFSNGCVVTFDEPTATPPVDAPTNTPTPVCGSYILQFEAFWPHGVVQFSIVNPGGTPVQITGIDMHWVNYFSGMNLDFIGIGGNNAYDPATVVVWDGNDVGTTVGAATNTATGTLGGEPTWLINATVNPGDTAYMWLDFDGTSEDLGAAYDAHDYDFNGTTIAFDNGCNVQPRTIPTPIPPQCGDNIVQPDRGEECDAGANNGVAGSGCGTDCKYTCGNGTVETGLGEQCDDGNRSSGDGCSSSCRTEYCGDGTRQSSLGEQCDDGNTNNTDSCDNNCRLTCGNGTINGSEQCDDGNRNSGDGCSSSCRREYCGDGTTQSSLGEQCDDGNSNNGDGCSSSCRIEPPVCGNGRRESGEQCDDGNTRSGDGCSSTCQIEPRCGDGSVNQPSEQCDDGNTRNGDGCSSTCQTEVASPVCGNGVVETGEECDPPNGTTCTSACKFNICTDC